MTFSAVERRPAFSMDAREMPSAMPKAELLGSGHRCR